MADCRYRQWWALSHGTMLSASVECLCQSLLSSVLYPAAYIEAEVYAVCEHGLWALWLW